jgi:hypothetical protein
MRLRRNMGRSHDRLQGVVSRRVELVVVVDENDLHVAAAQHEVTPVRGCFAASTTSDTA